MFALKPKIHILLSAITVSCCIWKKKINGSTPQFKKNLLQPRQMYKFFSATFAVSLRGSMICAVAYADMVLEILWVIDAIAIEYVLLRKAWTCYLQYSIHLYLWENKNIPTSGLHSEISLTYLMTSVLPS